jgi:hypothetical protein
MMFKQPFINFHVVCYRKPWTSWIDAPYQSLGRRRLDQKRTGSLTERKTSNKTLSSPQPRTPRYDNANNLHTSEADSLQTIGVSRIITFGEI